MTKGNTPAGNTTVTQNTVNPVQQAQLPYLMGQPGHGIQGWNGASVLTGTDPYQYYPNQTLANFDPSISQGYQDLINNPNFNTSNAANNAFLNGVGGNYSVFNSPAYNGLSAIGSGAGSPLQAIQYLYGNGSNAPAYLSGPVDNLYGVGSQALSGNPAAMGQLTATANGKYLNSNPYIAAEYKAAAQPVVNAYQTATAPQTDSNFEIAGRYGSGALANAQGQNQLNLGTTLDNLSANLYGQDYANERGLQTSAAGTLGTLNNQNLNTGANAFGTSGQLELGALGQGASAFQAGGALDLGTLAQQNAALGGLQSGYQAGNTAQNQALLMEPNVLSGNLSPAQAMIQGGQGLTGLSQAQINDAMQRFYGVQQAPWQTNQEYLNAIGQPTTGSSLSTTTQPYFQNGLANILGAGVGGLGLFNGLNSATGGSLGSGLSSIFGGGGGAELSNAALASLGIGGAAGLAGDAAGGFSAAGLGLLGGL